MIAPVVFESFPVPEQGIVLVPDSDGSFRLANSSDKLQSHLNPAAALVWSYCDGFRSVRDIVNIVSSFDVGVETGEVEQQVLKLLKQFRDEGFLQLSVQRRGRNRFGNQAMLPEPAGASWVDVFRYNTNQPVVQDRYSARGARLVEFCLGSYADTRLPPCSADISYSKQQAGSGVLLLEHGDGVLKLQCLHDGEAQIDDQNRIIETLLRQGVEIPEGLRCWLIRGDGMCFKPDHAQGPHIGINRKTDARQVILVPGAGRESYVGAALAVRMKATRNQCCAWHEKSDTAWWGGVTTEVEDTREFEPLSGYRLLRYYSDNPTEKIHLHPVSYPDGMEDGMISAKGSFSGPEVFRHKCLVVAEGGDNASSLSWYFCGNSVVLMRPPAVEHMLSFELKPWVHYVPLEADPADILVKLDWVLHNEEEARSIVARAHDHLRWFAGPECLWACNEVIRRVAGESRGNARGKTVFAQACPIQPRRKPDKTPVVFYGHYGGPAFRLGGSIIIEALNQHGIPAYSGENISLDAISDSIVVLVHRVVLSDSGEEVHRGGRLRRLLLELRSRNNIIVYDVRDQLRFVDADNPARDLVDQIIFPTRVFMRRFLENGGATARLEAIHGFCDPRILHHKTSSVTEDRLCAVYYGRPYVWPPGDSARFDLLQPRTSMDMNSHLDALKQYNLHIDVNDDMATRERKPLTKIFTAAGCKANIITERTERTLEILPPDYPFFIEHPEQLTQMLDFAKSEYGGPLWHKGLTQMADIRSIYTVEEYMKHFVPLLESL